MRAYIVKLYASLLLIPVLLLGACGTTATSRPVQPTVQSTQPTSVDAFGTPIVFPSSAPQRIVSLVPSTSEILASLGVANHVVAVDYYTNYPASMAALPKVSDGESKYNIEQIVSFKPDLILSYGGSTQQTDKSLSGVGLHVVDLPVASFSQVFQQIELVGRLTFTQDVAHRLVQSLQTQVVAIEAKVAGSKASKGMIELDYSTPGKPYVFGGGSFGDDLLQDAAASNIFHTDNGNQGYPQVTDEAIIAANPQFIILTEDPKYGGDIASVYHRSNWANIIALKQKKVFGVNSDIISRPGPRLVEALRCIAQILHSDRFNESLPVYCTSGAI